VSGRRRFTRHEVREKTLRVLGLVHLAGVQSIS